MISSFKIEAGQTFLAIMVNMKKEFLQKALGGSRHHNSLMAAPDHKFDLGSNRADRSLIEQKHILPRSVTSKINKIKYELVQEIINFDKNSSIPEKLFIKANILKIMALFIQRITDKNERTEQEEQFSDTSKILEVKKMIEDYAGNEHISLDDLAKSAAISKTKLKTKFKEVTGKSAYQYYLEVKMEKARTMLEDSCVPISSLAYEMGFKSPSHFSQAFKKHYGVNPRSVTRAQEA
jgi:AraC-like DNA-binding protein